MTPAQPEIPLACDLNAIPTSERAAHEITTQQLFAAVIEIEELADGYSFHLPAQPTVIHQVAAFIANERLCCPFFRFALMIEPGADTLRFNLSGQEDVKALIAAEIIGKSG